MTHASVISEVCLIRESWSTWKESMQSRRKIKAYVFLLGILLVFAVYKHMKLVCNISSELGLAHFVNVTGCHMHKSGVAEFPPVKTVTKLVETQSDKKYPLTTGENVYVIQNEKVCSENESVNFLLLVHSATDNSERRQSIRRTWANRALLQTFNGRIIFVLGKPKFESEQEQIKHESDTHGDIVQGDFVDTYRNLTNKAVLGVRWITENCRKTRYVLKFDDDVFVSTVRVFQYLSSTTDHTKPSRTIICYRIPKGTALIQRSTGKWKVDKNEFRNLTFWPVTFCRGFFVIISGDLMPDLYRAAKTTPFLWIDDVYVYGLLADRAGNVSHFDLKHLRRYVSFVRSSNHMYALWNNTTSS